MLKMVSPHLASPGVALYMLKMVSPHLGKKALIQQMTPQT